MIPNNGPKDAAEYTPDIDELTAEMEALDALEVNDTVAAQLNDLMDKARKTKKSADNDRKAIKQPFLDGGRDVDARFKPVSASLDNVVKAAKAKLTPYLQEQARIAAEAERKAREEAERKAKAAAILKNDQDVQELADRAEKEATLAAAKADNAGRAGSMSGMARTASLRTYYDAQVTDPYKAAAHFATNPRVLELVCSLAEAEMRSDKTKSIQIPGIAFNERKEVA